MKTHIITLGLVLIVHFCAFKADAQTVDSLIDKISNRFCDSLLTYQIDDANPKSFAEHFLNERTKIFDLRQSDVRQLFQLTFDEQTHILSRKAWQKILEKTIKNCKMYRLLLFPKNNVTGELRPLLRQISDSACVCFTLKTENIPAETLFDNANNENTMTILFKCIMESSSLFARKMVKEYQNEKIEVAPNEGRLTSIYLLSHCDRAVQSHVEVMTPVIIRQLTQQVKKKRGSD